MSKKKTLVTVGMPVYNGERFLTETLDSLLAQTFEDFTLLISDNGSTDRTQEICLDYAAGDGRISYYRHEQNKGATWNFNHVFRLSVSRYFKWAAHDDLYAKQYLERCVEILDLDSSVVTCFSRARLIDEEGVLTRNLAADSNVASPKPYKRFLASVFSPPAIQVFGVIRRNVLARTRLIGNFSSSDRTLAAELALFGRFHQIQEELFFYRRHSEQSTGTEYRTRQAREAWYDPARDGRATFPHWRLLAEHLRSTCRAPIGFSERLFCLLCLGRWAARKGNRLSLMRNVIFKEYAEAQFPVTPPSGAEGDRFEPRRGKTN